MILTLLDEFYNFQVFPISGYCNEYGKNASSGQDKTSTDITSPDKTTPHYILNVLKYY
jgi:hypothetical protein